MASDEQLHRISDSAHESSHDDDVLTPRDQTFVKHASGWDVDENDVIVIRSAAAGSSVGCPSVLPEKESPAESDVISFEDEKQHDEEEDTRAVGRKRTEDDDSVPFSAMRRIVIILCVVGVLVFVLYLMDYWGIITLPG